MIRIILVDDHAIIRDGIRSLLEEEPDFQIVGEAANGQEALAVLANMPADLVLMDLNMPVMGGQEAMERIGTEFPELKVLILTMLDHEEYVRRLMEAGASGYILKNTGKEEIAFAIRYIMAGHQFMSSELGFGLLEKVQNMPFVALTEPGKKPGGLSQRELEVLKLIAEGLTTHEIAEQLFTSRRTIETHRQNLIEKAKVKNTAALIRFAVTEGLLT
jgi:DNA-binding NarL/FixJ family response regulator